MQLGKRPPIVTLVDFPGFGHAVASKQEKDMWQHMVSNLLWSLCWWVALIAVLYPCPLTHIVQSSFSTSNFESRFSLFSLYR